MVSGTAAMRMPVTEESIQRSPIEMAENGMMNSTTPKAQTATLCVPNERNAPRCPGERQ